MLLVLSLALALAACSSSPSPSSGKKKSTRPATVVTPTEALKVVSKTSATNNRANARLSSSLLESYETGSALTIDNATYAADRAAHYVPPATPFDLTHAAVGVSRDKNWPAEFVVKGTLHQLGHNLPKEPTCSEFLLFRRAAASGQWQIFLEPTTDPLSSLRFQSSGGGYVTPPSRSLERAVAGLPQAFSHALLHEELTGDLGPFTRADFTGSCWSIPNPRADFESAEASGFSQRDLYHPVFPPDTTTVPLAGGDALVIFTVVFSDQMVEGSPSRPIGWTHPKPTASPDSTWPYFIAAGGYRSIDEKGEIEVAVVYSPATKKWKVAGSYGGVTSVSGTPAGKTTTTVPTGTLDTVVTS